MFEFIAPALQFILEAAAEPGVKTVQLFAGVALFAAVTGIFAQR